MEKQFKCFKCGKVNNFDTETARFLTRLSESRDSNQGGNTKIAYIIDCKFCQSENKIKI